MLSLAGARVEPHEDFDDEAREALEEIRGLVRKRGAVPDSKEFASLWSELKHKNRFPKPTKCGYCEARKRRKAELHVEHYRPKAAVNDWVLEDWLTEPYVRDTRVPEKRIEGHGYWWLAYLWNNYLLACSSCNSTFKSNLFPLDGARGACAENGHIDERPLLLHPYEPFESREHFCWDPSGIVHPCSPRGRATILVCGLNCSDLVDERREYHRSTVAPAIALWRSKGDEESEDALERVGARTAPFAAMTRWFYEQAAGEHWNELFGP